MSAAMRLFKRAEDEAHAVEIYETRPYPGAEVTGHASGPAAGAFDPYFIAFCSCGWSSEARPTKQETVEEARRHNENVDEQARVRYT
jgi:hypothetical protein